MAHDDYAPDFGMGDPNETSPNPEVFIVVRGGYDDSDILGVFTSIEAARASQPNAEWRDEWSGHLPADEAMGDQTPYGVHIEKHQVS